MADAYPEAVGLISDLGETLRPLITDEVPLSRCTEVVDRVTSPANVKVLVVPE